MTPNCTCTYTPLNNEKNNGVVYQRLHNVGSEYRLHSQSKNIPKNNNYKEIDWKRKKFHIYVPYIPDIIWDISLYYYAAKNL